MWKKDIESFLIVLGDNPSAEQQQNLLAWISSNVPPFYMDEAMNMCAFCGDMYYLLSERDAEMGNWRHRQ